jgi:hypothetical protein
MEQVHTESEHNERIVCNNDNEPNKKKYTPCGTYSGKYRGIEVYTKEYYRVAINSLNEKNRQKKIDEVNNMTREQLLEFIKSKNYFGRGSYSKKNEETKNEDAPTKNNKNV